MADDLQGLIDRIQKDGVAKADAAATEITSKAQARAEELVRAAEAKAEAIIKKAEADSKIFTQRSVHTLEQAARDIVLLVGGGVITAVENLLSGAVAQTMGPDTLKDLITRMVQAYAQKGMADGRAEILLNPDDQATVKQFAAESLRQELAKGLSIGADSRIKRGFEISMDGGRVRHDFTYQAIAETLAEFLRPALAELVRNAAAAMVKDAKTNNGNK